MMKTKYSIGLDYGTNSVRAVLVDLSNGEEVSTSIFNYKHGVDGIIIDKKNPLVARQHPKDYLNGLEFTINDVLRKASKNKKFKKEDVIGIGVDATGSTPIPVDNNGVPLAFQNKFKDNINALAWLWKDHSGFVEAEEITKKALRHTPNYTSKSGFSYSSEWFFSKILHCLRTDKNVFGAAYSWVEFCDYIPAVLTGNTYPLKLKRSICAAGHKAMYNSDWNGLPSKKFLSGLAPELGDLRNRLYNEAGPAGVCAGKLSREWQKKLGLSEIAVSVGSLDAHTGAVGAGIKPSTLIKIIGTSACDIMVAPAKTSPNEIPGVCGIVNGSVMNGYYGIEAGQSAVGDIFNWFVKNFVPLEYHNEAKKRNVSVHSLLTEKASKYNVGETGIIALDWNNGNRTILSDPLLSGLIVGQTLHTKPEEIYRALIEATAFGARVIIERMEEYRIKIDEIITTGGIPEKNPLLMQIYADITDRPLKMSGSSQSCALGAAIFGAVAAGRTNEGFDKVEDAQKILCRLKKKVYCPITENRKKYDKLYRIYKKLHDSFGVKNSELYNVMKELIHLKRGGI